VPSVASTRNYPPLPVNVRLVTPDGEVIPCELRYLGVDDGRHVWCAVNVIAAPSGLYRLAADVLPLGTKVIVLLRHP
jgi:hypothetical protein